MKFAVVSKEGVIDHLATAKKLADVMKDFSEQVSPYVTLKTDPETGKVSPANTFVIDKETRTIIKEGLVYVGAFQAPRGGEGGGRQSSTDFATLQTVYSKMKSQNPALTSKRNGEGKVVPNVYLCRAVATEYNNLQKDITKHIEGTTVARYVQDEKINDVSLTSVTEPATV